MRNKNEILKEIEKIEKDERLFYEPADIFTNAPLALIQVDLKASYTMLRWALGEDTVPLPYTLKEHDKYKNKY